MNNSEHILEFDKIKQIWCDLAMTDFAKQKIDTLTPCLNESELLTWQRETSEAKNMIEKCGNPPVISFAGIPDILNTAQKEGCLTPEQLETVGRTLAAIRRLQDYLNRCKVFGFSLAYYEENLDPCQEVREMIDTQIRNGQVDDHATKLLLSIRNEMETANTKMHEKADQIMRTNKNILADHFSTLRNGHICIPIKKEYRYKISGSVMDKSSTGNTVFIEPAAVQKQYEALQLLQIDEENEEMRIRYTLTALLLDHIEAFTQNIRTVEKLDFAFSKGKLSLEYDGKEPHINTTRKIYLRDARHPLMDKEVCVPLRFEMEDPIRGIIITGPNTGGKTVTLKTVALCCMMAQCGLHVPCREADLCMNSNYLCDIGDGQSLSENLSTFSAHLKNILNILNEVNPESLVVLDELGSGTDPTEGMGIAVAVLEELKKSQALFLVTTHYPEIKQYAKEESVIQNARMDFDKENLAPLYQLIIGEAGESCAFSIAKRLGMPDDMLKNAALAAYGTAHPNQLPKMENPHKKLGNIHTKPDIPHENLDLPHKKPGGTHTKPEKRTGPRIQKQSKKTNTVASAQKITQQFHLGDSVFVYPDKKIGIVCQTANEKGVLRVQMPDKKIWINHKRIKLNVPANELYPEDYDFSIIFDSVETRKLRHQMDRKYVEDTLIPEDD
ncbi:MAG: DNA mismatch repair protein MutS [Clostridia bacterium]|nr:DNA mismatch repair protein MutS [Clostridia bacterium]